MTLASGAAGLRVAGRLRERASGFDDGAAARASGITSVVLFALWANLPTVAVHYHGVPAVAAYAFTLLLALPCVFHVVARGEPILFPRPLFWMVAYLAVAAVSGAFSDRPQEALERVMAHTTEGLVLYLLVVNAVRGRSAVRRALWAVVAAGALMGTLSIAQRVSGDYENELGGLAQVSASEVAASGAAGGSRFRIAGPVGEKNRYAQILLVLLPIAACFAAEPTSTTRRRLAAMGAAVAIGGGMLFTYSRGALISAVLALAWIGWLARPRLGRLVALAALAAGLVVLAAPEAVDRIVELKSAVELAGERPTLADSSVRGRATENLAAVRIFVEQPWIGIGPGQAQHKITQYGNELRLKRLIGSRRAHNMYLEELAEVGILGFLPFAAMLVTTLAALGLPRRPGLALALHGAVVAYLMSAVFLHLSYQRYFFLLLALAAVAGHCAAPWQDDEPRAAREAAIG